MNRFALPLLLGLPALAIACGGENLTLPSDGEPATIAVLSGNEQSGRVGTALALPLVVQVTDNRDRPVPGASVVFEFTDQASGTATPATVTSDADGKASSQLQLGSSVGSLTGRVHVPVEANTVPVEAAFTATALSDDANGIAAVSGQDQSGAVNTALKDPLVVRVTDKFGNPIPGVQIGWTAEGGGSVSEASNVTDADGQASVTRTLGPNSGPQSTSATADGLAGSPVVFSHAATAGAASRIEKTGGDGQSALAGTELPTPVSVRVLDAANNPIPGRAVTWVIGTGQGSVTPMNSITDGQGRTSATWTLGPNPGANSLTVVSGVGTATFNATGTAGTPSTSNSTVRASPTTIAAGGSPSTITVTVKDAGGNTVSGVAVSITASGTGNDINPASATSNDNGVATFTFASNVAESKTISATIGGSTVDQTATVTVQKVSSSTKIVSDDPEPSVVGEKVTVVFTVTAAAGGTPTGNVTVTAQGGSETCQASVDVGTCDITFTAAGTNRRLTATYEGDAQFAGSSDNENHRVNAAPPPDNTAPVAVDDAYNGSRVVGLIVPLQGDLLTANDHDPDGDPVSAVAETKPTLRGGAVTINADGSFTYAPPFPGTAEANDSFDYTVTDGKGGTDVGTATITYDD